MTFKILIIIFNNKYKHFLYLNIYYFQWLNLTVHFDKKKKNKNAIFIKYMIYLFYYLYI